MANGSTYSHATAVQPFTVKVHPDVPFLCDLHAHLADSEIIGFLAGRFDREQQCLYIQVRRRAGACLLCSSSCSASGPAC